MCENDYDGDGVADTHDSCRQNPAISAVSFTGATSVTLDPSSADPEWEVTADGREVREVADDDVIAMLIGELSQQ